ncbi:hypothetical protein KR018_002544, partial [Drosophila ironensis]
RYTEDLKKPAKNHGESNSNEDEILQKLLQKAEKRKRKHKETEAVKPKEEEEEEAEEPAKEEPEQKENSVENERETRTEEEEEPQPANDFQVLGAEGGAGKRSKVEVQLPSWLAHPTIIPGGSLQPADEIPEGEAVEQLPYLDKATCRALRQMKIRRLFPVQREVIPWLLEAQAKPPPFRPRDICVSAPTGSGKTLAFAIPIVQLLAQRVECKVRALVVLPVAELALQVYRVISGLCSQTELEVCLLSKQHKLEDEQERLVELYKGKYYSKVDIVVTTPGRLVDHLHATKGFCLKSLRFLVIDEADRIMDAVFQNWLYHLDSHVKEATDSLLAGIQAPLCYAELESSFGRQPHKLLFSATLSQDPEKLQNLRLFQPRLFTTLMPVIGEPASEEGGQEATSDRGQFLGKYTTPAELTEQICITELRLKPLTLYALVKENQWRRFLCFTNSTDQASRLAFVLTTLFEDSDTKIAELSGNLSALVRNKTLKDFASGKVNGLVCSDALARGIDVADIDVVLSYEAPRHIKTHIHRVGRTARAGRKGTAVTLLSEQEVAGFTKMLHDVGKGMGEEITVSPDIEVEHAAIYKKALTSLRKQKEIEKSQKAVKKRRVAQQAIVHKKQEEAKTSSRPLTIMEKLQLKAGAGQAGAPDQTKKTKPEKVILPRATKKQVIAKKRKAIEQ